MTSAEAAAMADSLRRTAGLLGRLAEHCRPDDHGGAQLEARVKAEGQKLLDAAGTLIQRRCKVALVGDFDAGKSTLISALAGRQLLPMHPNPATALVTWISHGDQESYYLCPAGGAAPRAIAGDDFRRFHHGDVACKDGLDHLEAHLPFPLLARGVVLLDTPGFDNGPDDTARTQSVISDCNGLILCTPAVHPLSERDLSLLKALVSPPSGLGSFRPEQVFLVLTFADAGQFQDDPALMGSLMVGLRTRLVGLGGLEGAAADDLLEHRSVAVSGRLALRARLKQHKEDELASGVKVLEERLDRFFLSLQEARLQGARSALASAAALVRGIREQSVRRVSELEGSVDALQQLCQKAQSKLDRLDKLLTASQQDFAERLPGVISQRLQAAQLGAVASPARLGLAAITNPVLSRWNASDQVRTAKVLQDAVLELSKRSARHLCSNLLEAERLARVTGNLRRSLLDLLAAPPGTGQAPVVSVPGWPAVVNDVMAGLGGALERRLSAALLESPPLQQCAKTAAPRLEAMLSRARVNANWAAVKQTVGSETSAESDERRRSELYAGICDAVSVALGSTDPGLLASTSLPGLFEELRLRLRAPLSERLQGWTAELQRAVEGQEAERRWAGSALQLLEDIEARLADQDHEASPRAM